MRQTSGRKAGLSGESGGRRGSLRHAMAVGDRFTVLNRGKTLGTAVRGAITSEQLQDLMAGGQELAKLESTLGGTV